MSVAEHERELGDLTQRLRDAGWASHVTATRLLQSWEKLASEVANYALTIDDFGEALTPELRAQEERMRAAGAKIG